MDEVLQGIKRVEEEIVQVESRLERVEDSIVDIDNGIKANEEIMKKAQSGSSKWKKASSDNERLWEEKKQLREKEKQLWEKEKLLREKEKQLREKEKQLREIQVLKMKKDQDVTPDLARVKRLKATLEIVSIDYDNEQFITLSADWRSTLSDTEIKVVLKRACYNPILDALLERVKLPSVKRVGPRAIVTGTPGVGKTVLGLLFVRELLRQDYAVLGFFQGKNNDPASWNLSVKKGTTTANAIIQGIHGLTAVEGVDNEEFAVYAVTQRALDELGDGKVENVVMVVDPGNFFELHCVNVPIVLFCSPSKDRFKAVKSIEGETLMLYVTPVPLEELQLMASRRVQPPAASVIAERFKQVGGVARACFDASKYNDYLSGVQVAISKIHNLETMEAILDSHGGVIPNPSIHEKNKQGNKPSGKLVHMVCDDIDDPGTMRYELASEAIGNALMSWSDKLEGDEARKFHRMLTSSESPNVSYLKGKYHEVYAHKSLCKGGQFKIRRAAENDETPDPGVDVQVGGFNLVYKDIGDNELRGCMQLSGQYLQPSSKTFASIDSFIVLDDPSAALFQFLFGDKAAKGLCCFQMFYSSSTKGKHPITRSGIINVAKAFRDEHGEDSPVAFVFVVPSLLFDAEAFQAQSYKKRGNALPNGVSQFVLRSDWKVEK